MAIDTDDNDPVDAEACEKYLAQLGNWRHTGRTERQLRLTGSLTRLPGPFTVSCG